MISSILWDMDGVLVETSEAHYQSWVVAFKHFGYDFNREYFLRYYGMNDTSTVRGFLSNSISSELTQAIGEYKEDWFRDHIKDQIHLLPGVTDWLAKFRERGYLQAVASSGPLENIDLIVTSTSIHGYFSALVSCADGPTKPDPWVFQEAARKLGSAPSECLVIEDTPNGVSAARNACMHCLAVTTSNPTDALKQADLVVYNLSKLNWQAFEEHFLQEN
ncbi:MAG: HAD family phosphatase [Anaerolineaceae bacterium]